MNLYQSVAFGLLVGTKSEEDKLIPFSARTEKSHHGLRVEIAKP